MTYVIKRISIDSVAKGTFLLLVLPLIPIYFVIALVMRDFEQFEFVGPTLGILIVTFCFPVIYAFVVALLAAILAFFYNSSVRFYGGIKIELQQLMELETQKSKNDP